LIPSARQRFRTFLRVLAGTAVGLLAIGAVTFLVRTPSNDRDWSLDQQRLATAEIAGDTITVRNVRHFTYRSEHDYTPRYYDRQFSLDDVVAVDYVVEPLASVAAAHTFLSFGLQNGERLAVSVEIRKERGEEFNPLLGLVNEYEIMYVLADERDVLQLRVLHRGNPVYVYPTTASPEQARALLLDVLARANEVAAAPEFYNTVANSCATNVARHVNAIVPRQVPWDWRLLFPKESDAYAHELGLIDDSMPLAEARERYRANDAVRQYADDPQFSRAIRDGR
jgi:hypothetical protein